MERQALRQVRPEKARPIREVVIRMFESPRLDMRVIE